MMDEALEAIACVRLSSADIGGDQSWPIIPIPLKHCHNHYHHDQKGEIHLRRPGCDAQNFHNLDAGIIEL